MKFKKLIAASLAAVLAFSTVYTASAAEVTPIANEELDAGDYFSEGVLYYRVLEDKTLEVCGVISGWQASAALGIENTDDTVRETIKELIIPNEVRGLSVTSIRPHAFEKCTSLASITIPASVKTIGDGAFIDTVLKSVIIPEGVMEIGVGPSEDTTWGAFWNCTSLTSVTLPNYMTTIGGMTFAGCNSLKNIKIPDGVTKIEHNSFNECTSLTSVAIPASVTTIDGYAFFNCISLDTVYYSGSKAEWEAIEIDDHNGGDDGYNPYLECLAVYGLKKAEIICTDGIINERVPEISEPTTSEPTTSEPTTSEPASKPTESTVVPGGSEKAQEILDATLKNVDSKNGIEGEKLDELLFGDSGWTWGQVEKIEFSSEELFSVQYKNDKGDWVKLGGEAAARAAADGIWNTAWTLNTSEMAKDNRYAKVIAKNGTADITVKVYIKKDAEKPSGSDQQPTGIALAIAPVVLAAGMAVVALSKKKK